MASNFKTEPVVPGVTLIRGVTPKALIGQKIAEKMFGPAEVQRFSVQHPEAFRKIMEQVPLFMGFSVTARAPLAESISPETGVLTVAGFREKLNIPNAKMILTPEELNAKNSLLVINPFICFVEKEEVYNEEEYERFGYQKTGMTVSTQFSPEMRQFIKFIENMPENMRRYGETHWYAEVNGIPKGAPSNEYEKSSLFLGFLGWDFGSFWRGFYSLHYGVVGDRGNGVILDMNIDTSKRFSGGILVPSDSVPNELGVAEK